MSDQKNNHSVLNRTGDKMPLVGLGCWKIPKDVCATTITGALQSGYRLLDSACDYGNEVEVGQGIAAAIQGGIPRSEIFVTSKLWNTFHGAHVREGCVRTLKDLGLEYLDLYLIHFPLCQPYVDPAERYPPEWGDNKRGTSTLHETWAAMEELVKEGLVRNIGVCNYNCSLITELVRYATIQPAVLQVERHPYLSQQRLVKYATENDIKMTAFSTFGGTSYLELGFAYDANTVSLLEHATVAAVAAAVGKTAGQVLLRWQVQNNIAVIPKSLKAARLAENLSLFDFALSADQMTQLDGLNKNLRFNDPGAFAGLPIYD